MRAEHSILDDFLAWAATTQQFAMQPALQACDDMLMAQLERVHRASVALSTANEPTPASGPTPGIHRIAGVEGPDVELAEAAGGGGEPLWVTVGGAAAAELRPGTGCSGRCTARPVATPASTGWSWCCRPRSDRCSAEAGRTTARWQRRSGGGANRRRGRGR